MQYLSPSGFGSSPDGKANSVLFNAVDWERQQWWDHFDKWLLDGLWPFKPIGVSVAQDYRDWDAFRYIVRFPSFEMEFSIYPQLRDATDFNWSNTDWARHIAELVVEEFNKLPRIDSPNNIYLGEN